MGTLGNIRDKLERYRQLRRWETLKALGMRIGKNVNLPFSTWIDQAHCHLISIGDHCGFGARCAILAHDAMPDEYLNASRIGRVTIHESCHFGMCTLILPGVTIGPRSVVGAGSVVIHDIPPDSVAAGDPAKVICSLEEFLSKHREAMKDSPRFEYGEYSQQFLTPEKTRFMLDKLAAGPGYMVGGYT